MVRRRDARASHTKAHISTRECTQNIKFREIRQEPEMNDGRACFSPFGPVFRMRSLYRMGAYHTMYAQIHIYFSWPRNHFLCAAISAIHIPTFNFDVFVSHLAETRGP